MKDKIESLTALFFVNTLSHMRIKTEKEAITNLESNIQGAIENIFIELQNISTDRLSNDSQNSFYPGNKWEKFKGEVWGYNCLTTLRELAISIQKTEGPISSKFIKDVEHYYKNEWTEKADTLKYKFSSAYYKKYKDYTKYLELSLSTMEMIADGFIVSFFEKHINFYKNYIKWIKNIKNLFSIKIEKKEIKFSYTEDEFKTLEDCVNSYNDLNVFDRKSFLDFILNIFSILDDISRTRLTGIDQIDEKEIRKEIELFYTDMFALPAETSGIIQGDIDSIIWRATNDAMDCYDFFRSKQGVTWEQCKSNKGFIAFMNHRLYFYLSCKYTSQFITQWIKGQVMKINNEYGVYINEKAQIKTRVWIGENCQIGNCHIDEECVINNSYIDDGAVLRSRVTIDGVAIKQGSILGPDIEIRGNLTKSICNGKIAKKS